MGWISFLPVKALQGTKGTNPNQWFGLIFSSSTPRLLMESTLHLLHWLLMSVPYTTAQIRKISISSKKNQVVIIIRVVNSYSQKWCQADTTKPVRTLLICTKITVST